MITRKAALAASLGVVLGYSASAPAQAPANEAPAAEAQAENWATAVVHLDYANAEEMAELLSQLLPPSVTVVAYYRTNTLVFSGDADVIETLVPEESEETEASDEDRESAAETATVARVR